MAAGSRPMTRHHSGASSAPQSDSRNESPENRPHPPKRHRGWRALGWILLVLMLLLGTARALLPWFARDYVNRTLDRNVLYEGRIGDVGIHLWRGAYSIENVKISKRTGNVPTPFFTARRLDFAMQW